MNTGRGYTKKLRAGAAALTLALLIAGPLGAQTGGSGPAQSNGAAGAAATTDETKLVIPEAAATSATAPAAASRAPGVSAWDFVRMALVLAAVVAAIYFLFWLLRRGAGRKIQENELIRVLGSRTLSGNRALHLVEVGRSIYLVGSAEGGVELIAEITDKESQDSVRLAAAEQGPPRRRAFVDVLAEVFRPARRPPSLRDGIDMLKRQRGRLTKLRGGQ